MSRERESVGVWSVPKPSGFNMSWAERDRRPTQQGPWSLTLRLRESHRKGMTTTQTSTIRLDGTATPLNALTARDLMRPVDSVIGEDATLRDVVQRFLDGPGRHLIVLDRDGRCAGVIGPRHIAQAHHFDARRDEEIRVFELGCAPWIALTPLDPLRTCAQLLVEHDLDAVPVLDGDQRILGIVTAQDIVRATADIPAPRRVHLQEQD